MKKILSCILVLVLMVTMIPMSPITVYAGDVTSDNFTFTSIDGDEIYIKPYQSEVTILVFGACYSSYTEDLLNSIANSDWGNCSEIRTVYIECSNEYCSSKTAVQDFANNIDDSDIIYCYDSSSGRMESYNAVAHYLENASGGGIEVIFPMVVLLDEYNHIKDVSQDVMSASNIIKKISLFADVNYIKATANINVSGQENYDYAYEVLNQLNELRKGLNLSALTMDEKLLDAAMQRAAEISVYFSHTRPNGEDCLTILEYLAGTTRGENIAMKQTTPESAMESWTNSIGHYENMINSEYQSAGIGCYKTSDGLLCWVQMFSSASSGGVTKTGTQSVIKTIEISKSKMLLEADLSKDSIIANGKDTSQLDVYLYHSDAEEGEFSKLDPSSFNYSSTNTSIASIDDQGIITSQLNGSANVTAALKDDSGIYISKAITSSGEIEADIKYGADRLSFGENITGYVGETLDTLVVYTTKEENIASLDISSSNSNVAEIGTIEIGNGEYIIGENECIATIPLNLKTVGTSTITITSPEGVSESIVVTVEDVSYEVKVYSSFPTLVIDKNSSIIIGLQTERNGEVWNDECQYTIAVSNSNIVTTSNLEYTSDGGAYLTLNGNNEGMAKITITESKSGAVFSTTISVAEQILTYNADAFKNTSIDDLGCNGFVSGMYIDGFTVSEPVNNCYPISFKVYNSKNIVGVVEVYDSNGQLKASNNINRFDGGTVTSIQDIFVSGWEVLEDASDGTLGTYKDLIHSEETKISVDVPIGGYIKITNNPTASETCAIYNCTEFLVNSYLLYGNVLDEVKGSVYSGTNEEIAKMVAESASKEVIADFIHGKISSDEVDDKLNSMGTRLIAELLEVTTDSVSSNYLKGTADSFVEVCKLIFSESGIDIVELIQENAVSLGFSGLEQYVLDEVGLVGDVISATFMAAETHQYTGYVVALFGKTQYEEMDIHFNAIDGSLVSNGVSIKSEKGELALTDSNFVMHSVVLSNEEDLTSEIKQSLDDISNDYVVRDIYLERDGVVSQPGQTVQVYMPVPDNYDPNKCKLYWVKDDGTLEQKEFTIVGNNIMFTTDHFSYWALVNENTAESDNLLGDVNGDGTVDSGDAGLISRYDTGLITLTSEQLEVGDVNGDGVVDAGDAGLISRYDAGLINQIGY